MKFNQIWYRVSAGSATAVGIACLVRGFNLFGGILLILAIGEYLIANYIFKSFKQNEQA